jgi:cytidine deaminase
MPNTPKRRLVQKALAAQKKAVAPYSKFRVGAALRTKDGQIILGANVESASYGLTCCAERVALFKALTEGHRTFSDIAVVAPLDGGATPCGACRQLLAEYAPDATVWVADSRKPAQIRAFTVRELLPCSFHF